MANDYDGWNRAAAANMPTGDWAQWLSRPTVNPWDRAKLNTAFNWGQPASGPQYSAVPFNRDAAFGQVNAFNWGQRPYSPVSGPVPGFTAPAAPQAKPSPAQVVAARRAAAVPPPSMAPSVQLGGAPFGVSQSQMIEAGKLGQTPPSMAPTLNVAPWQPPGPVSGAAGRTPVQSAYVSPGAPSPGAPGAVPAGYINVPGSGSAVSLSGTGVTPAQARGAITNPTTVPGAGAAPGQDPASMWSWGNPHAWSTVINGLGTAGNLTLGTMAYLQGQEEFEFQKEFANRNFNNQVDTYNSAREDRIRGQFSSDTKEQEDAKVAKGALKKKK